MWVRPPGKHSAEFAINARKGTFLGYLPNTTSNTMWYDLSTNRGKIAKHARFDEGMNDLPFVDIPPNVQHLIRARDGKELEEDTNETSIHSQPVLVHDIEIASLLLDLNSALINSLTVPMWRR